LLIVGGDESGCAAAVQAARLGVPRIVLVNDIEWLDGLFGCSKNIGYSSVVSSAVRLHGHMMHVGQTVGTAAWLCLRDVTQPRDLARNWARVRELQTRLVCSAGGPGVLLWPFHDLAPDDLHFEAANTLHRWLTALKLPANGGLARQKELPLRRAELVIHLWAVLKTQPEWLPNMATFLQPGNDLDRDSVPDLEDGLPLPRRL